MRASFAMPTISTKAELIVRCLPIGLRPAKKCFANASLITQTRGAVASSRGPIPFHQKLTNDACSPGSHCQANCDFLSAPGRASQEQVCDVGAYNQQNQAGQGQQDGPLFRKFLAAVKCSRSDRPHANALIERFLPSERRHRGGVSGFKNLPE